MPIVQFHSCSEAGELLTHSGAGRQEDCPLRTSWPGVRKPRDRSKMRDSASEITWTVRTNSRKLSFDGHLDAVAHGHPDTLSIGIDNTLNFRKKPKQQPVSGKDMQESLIFFL